jgi:hypothetical protein
MKASFSIEQLLTIFEHHNQTFWLIHILAYVLGIIVLVLLFRKSDTRNKIINNTLAIFWLWTGVVFFILYFGQIYKPAYIFGALFIIQALLFTLPRLRSNLSYHYAKDIYSIIGIIFILYAMIGYPLVGLLVNHIYPATPAFTLAPCPLVIFTFGVFLNTEKTPKLYLVIPLFWAISGFIPISIGMVEDIGLIVAGIVGTILLFVRDKK